MRHALRDALAGYSPLEWSEVDITDAYQAARRHVFATCHRVELSAKPGEAYFIHRLTLHGVAPWSETAAPPPEGRSILYFQPDNFGSVADWLNKK